MPLVFQPISCLKRLPTSALCQHTPLSHSLTFVWHTDNRKIARPNPPALANSLLNAAAFEFCYDGDAPSEPCHCYLSLLKWRGTDRHTHTHTLSHKSFSVGIQCCTIIISSKNVKADLIYHKSLNDNMIH